MRANYRDHGYTRLLYVNTASVVTPVIEELTTAMGDAPKVTVLMTSNDEVTEARLARREVGGGLHSAAERRLEAARGLESEALEER
jgi:hypothetical protein